MQNVRTFLHKYLSDPVKVALIIVVLITLGDLVSLWFIGLALLFIFIHLHYRLSEIKDIQHNLYHQQQALQSIHALIDIRSPLPTMGEWAASPDFLHIITDILLDRKPLTVVECGSGVSSVVIGYLLKKNGRGHLYSLENSDVYAIKNTELICRHRLNNQVSILHAPLTEMTINDEQKKWYDTTQITTIQSIDILIIDGPTGHRYPALPILHTQLSENALIIVDDCNRKKDRENVLKWQHEFGLNIEWLNTEKGPAVLGVIRDS